IPAYDHQLYQSIIKHKVQFILPSVVKGTGQFPNSVAKVVEGDNQYLLSDIERGRSIPKLFENYDTSFAALNISLAIQTKVAFERVGMKDGLPVFVEGGFRHNLPYCKVLSALYPSSEISLTNLYEASAFGAAICGKSVVEKRDPMDMSTEIKIEKDEVKKPQLEGLEDYVYEYLKLV
ncbi:MAG: hypothetical protein AAGC88_03630, partial [Bacteroidota bacterium]